MAKKTATPDNKFLSLAQDLLKNLGINATVATEEKDEHLVFQIDTEDPGILIGFHGETLSSFQRILGLMIEKQEGEWKKIVVNVGDYRERREETLKNLALSTAQRVKFSGQEQSLPSLSPSERRVVHLILSEHPDVYTESVGDGVSRKLVVKLRTK